MQMLVAGFTSVARSGLGALLALAIGLLASCGGEVPHAHVSAWRIDGREIVRDDVITLDEERAREALNEQAVAAAAAVEFACPVGHVRVEAVGFSYVFMARGCGHGTAFVRVVRLDGDFARYRSIQTIRFFDVLANISDVDAAFGPSPSPDPLYLVPPRGGERTAAGYVAAEGVRERIALWRELLLRGTQDLACPQDQITIDVVWDKIAWHHGGPTFPVAEGCGRRAIYDRHPIERLCDPSFVNITQLPEGTPATLPDAESALRVRAAVDLQCPAGAVAVRIDEGEHHRWPVAEGCAKRAVYLPTSVSVVPASYRVRRVTALDAPMPREQDHSEACPPSDPTRSP